MQVASIDENRTQVGKPKVHYPSVFRLASVWSHLEYCVQI